MEEPHLFVRTDAQQLQHLAKAKPAPILSHSYALDALENTAAALPQLASSKTLASQANARQSIACGSLRHPWCSRSCVKDILSSASNTSPVAFDASSPARPRPGGGKAKLGRRPAAARG